MTTASGPHCPGEFLLEAPAAWNGNHLPAEISPPTVTAGEVSPLLMLWGRRRVLARALALGASTSVLIAFLIPPRYDSTVRLMPPDGPSGSALATLSGISGKSLGLGALPEGLLGLHSSSALFVEILGSRNVQDRIVERFDLRHVYGEKYWVEARRRLQDDTDISQDRKSEVTTIQVTDRDSGRAARIAQAYVEELDRVLAQVSTSTARRERIFVGGRLAEVSQELDRASREFSLFASSNATMDITSQARSALESAARVQGELIASESELQGLEQVYTTRNVRVRSQIARVEELQRQLSKLDGDTAGLRPEPAMTPRGLEGRGSAFPSIRQIPLLGVRWAELYRQMKMEETVYELLTQQYELAKIEEAKEIPTVKVLDAAEVPEKKSFPPRLIIAALGALLSLSGAVLWVLARGRWEELGPGDPRKRLGQELAGWWQGFWLQRAGQPNQLKNEELAP